MTSSFFSGGMLISNALYRLAPRLDMKGAGKFEPSSSKIVFEDSEEDEEEHSCSSVSSSDEVRKAFRMFMKFKTFLFVDLLFNFFNLNYRFLIGN